MTGESFNAYGQCHANAHTFICNFGTTPFIKICIVSVLLIISCRSFLYLTPKYHIEDQVWSPYNIIEIKLSSDQRDARKTSHDCLRLSSKWAIMWGQDYDCGFNGLNLVTIGPMQLLSKTLLQCIAVII